MKHVLGRSVGSIRVPLYISIGFGFSASLLYYVAGFTGGRLGVWYVLYFLGFPVSWATNQITARLEGLVPDWLFNLCYVADVILAAMVWIFLIALLIKYIVARLRSR